MKGRLADFFFVGLGVAPVALMLGGLPHLAILVLVPLLFIACLFGMAEQLGDETPKNGSGGDAGSPPREAPTLTYRKAKGGRRKAKV